MSEQTKVLPVTAKSEGAQGLYEWSFTYKDGSYVDKYLDTDTKNVYVFNGHVQPQLTNVLLAELYNKKGECVTSLKVPNGAVVFQRRLGFTGTGGVNYYNRFFDVIITIPKTMMALVPSKTRPGEVEWVECAFDKEANQYISPPDASQFQLWPERKIPKKVPEITYNMLWIIGWRKRESDGSISVCYHAVYPDGKVDVHHAWKEQAWLFEPEWYSEEQV